MYRSDRYLSAILALAAATMSLLPMTAAAQQPLGTFRWQLEPHCNIVSVTVTPSGGVFRMEGSDDQCGAGSNLASTIGTAFINPDGTVGIGLNVVSTPGGAPVHVDAAISVSTLNGTWRDSAGNSGNFTFRTGAGSGGSPRLLTSDVTSVSVGPGLQAGGSTGAVTVALASTVGGGYEFDNESGFVSNGILGSGTLARSGPGTRLLWYPGKGALRAGSINGPQWDDANIGLQSVAMGANTIASGIVAFAIGNQAAARGDGSVALGSHVDASTDGTFMFGDRSTLTNMLTVLPNQFLVRAAGGFGFYSSANLSTGCTLPGGSAVMTCTSDRNSKDDFEPIDGELVLTKLRGMPTERWSYRSEPGVTHVGPVAQDFHAAFGLGVDDKSIGHLDLSGISLRAIQALDERTRAAEERNRALEAEVTALRALEAEVTALRTRLAQLETLLVGKVVQQ